MFACPPCAARYIAVAPHAAPSASTTASGHTPASHSSATVSTCPPTVATQTAGKPLLAASGLAPACSILRTTDALPVAAADHSARLTRWFAAASSSTIAPASDSDGAGLAETNCAPTGGSRPAVLRGVLSAPLAGCSRVATAAIARPRASERGCTGVRGGGREGAARELLLSERCPCGCGPSVAFREVAQAYADCPCCCL